MVRTQLEAGGEAPGPAAPSLAATGRGSPELGALGTEGIFAAMSIEAATDADVFCAFLDQVLLPALRQRKPDAVLVMDNLSAHKARAVRRLLDRSEFSYRYLTRRTSTPSSRPGRK